MDDTKWHLNNNEKSPFFRDTFLNKLDYIDDSALDDVKDWIDKNGDNLIIAFKPQARPVFTIKNDKDGNEWYVILLGKEIEKLGIRFVESEVLKYMQKLADYDKYVDINGNYILDNKENCPTKEEQPEKIINYAKEMEELNFNALLVQAVYLQYYDIDLYMKSDTLVFVFKNRDEETLDKYYKKVGIPLEILDNPAELMTINNIYTDYFNKYIQKITINYIKYCDMKKQ